MEAMFEIVRVLDERSLINSESYQCNYLTAYGEALEPGYYVVVWETPEGLPSYAEGARFFGPCRSRAEAVEFVQRAMRSADDEAQQQPVSRVLH